MNDKPTPEQMKEMRAAAFDTSDCPYEEGSIEEALWRHAAKFNNSRKSCQIFVESTIARGAEDAYIRGEL